jgi:uncharacterized membrane protein YccC
MSDPSTPDPSPSKPTPSEPTPLDAASVPLPSPDPIARNVEPARRGLYYALRTGVAAGIATAIWQYLHLDRGWWIAVAAVVVIQPERTATMAKSLNRVLGTVIGAISATLAAMFLPLNPATATLVVAFTVALAWRFPNLREPLPLAAVTAILVFTLDDQQQSLSIGLWRSVEIIAGVAIGLGLAAIPLPGETRPK